MLVELIFKPLIVFFSFVFEAKIQNLGVQITLDEHVSINIEISRFFWNVFLFVLLFKEAL